MEYSEVIDKSFNALTENQSYLTKEMFIKSMKKYQVSLFTGLKPDAPDYESCCAELFDALLSQCAEEPLPKSSIHIDEPKEEPFATSDLPSDLPAHLQFVADSREGVFPDPAKEGGESAESDEKAVKDSISLKQFK